MDGIFLGVVIAVSVGCAALSWAHLRRVARAVSADVRGLTASLQRVPAAERAGELARRASTESWEHRLAVELLGAASSEARVAAANDALAEIEIALSAGAGWSHAAIRICAFSTLLVGVIGWLMGASGNSILAVAGIGGAGAIACASAGRRARREARKQREAVDALMSGLMGPAPDASATPNLPPERRPRPSFTDRRTSRRRAPKPE